ncbi:hypothetical protein BDF14DRAFT_1803992 [Spinellus fusiger]|nr:hypothetical protein BDF14DRAFT_1803992 [Spinellus fusiger]
MFVRLVHTLRPFTYAQASEWMSALNRSLVSPNVSLSFSRSSGPGGQNVNKVSTKVTLRLSTVNAPWLPGHVKEKLAMTKIGDLIITSDRTRSQAKNIDDCYSKLLQQLRQAAQVPKEPDASTLARVKTL